VEEARRTEGYRSLGLERVLTFLATAGAFLLLASLGSDSPISDPIPQAEPSSRKSSSPALALELPEDRLQRLERAPGQRLTVDVENGSEEEFRSVDLALVVASENTVRPHARYYWATSENLASGSAKTVEFYIDLSPPAEDDPLGTGPQEDREILEIRATTPEGASAVKTAVLTP
jgi:hypothetical protein